MIRKTLVSILLGLLIIFPKIVLGAVIDITNSNALPDGYLYAQVTVVQGVDTNTVAFTVDPLNTFLTQGENFGLQTFGFNTDLLDPISTGNPSGQTPTSLFSFSGPSGWDFNYNGNLSEFGTFELVYDGSGGTRQDPLVFTLQYKPEGVAVAITPGNFIVTNGDGWRFAMHIADFTPNIPGFDGGNFESAWFADGTAPIPEPGTMLLLGSGLIGLAGWGRKKFRK